MMWKTVTIIWKYLPGEEKIKVLGACVNLANEWKTNCSAEVQLTFLHYFVLRVFPALFHPPNFLISTVFLPFLFFPLLFSFSFSFSLLFCMHFSWFAFYSHRFLITTVTFLTNVYPFYSLSSFSSVQISLPCSSPFAMVDIKLLGLHLQDAGKANKMYDRLKELTRGMATEHELHKYNIAEPSLIALVNQPAKLICQLYENYGARDVAARSQPPGRYQVNYVSSTKEINVIKCVSMTTASIWGLSCHW